MAKTYKLVYYINGQLKKADETFIPFAEFKSRVEAAAAHFSKYFDVNFVTSGNYPEIGVAIRPRPGFYFRAWQNSAGIGFNSWIGSSVGSSYPWNSPSITALALHEFGHYFGRGHDSKCTQSIMHSHVGQYWRDTDISKLQKKLGTRRAFDLPTTDKNCNVGPPTAPPPTEPPVDPPVEPPVETPCQLETTLDQVRSLTNQIKTLLETQPADSSKCPALEKQRKKQLGRSQSILKDLNKVL